MADNDQYESLKATALAYVHAHEATDGPLGKCFDPSNIYAYRTPSAPQRFHPSAGMPHPFNTPITRTEHEPACLILSAVISELTISIHEVIVDVKERRVVVRLEMNFVFKPVREDPMERDWPIEYVWILEIGEGEGKVVRVEECLDTARASYMLERARTYAAEHSQYL